MGASIPDGRSTVSGRKKLNINTEFVFTHKQLLGGLLGASIVQIIVGATGLVSLTMHLIGPLTAAPVLIHVTLILCPVALEMSQKHWGLALL